MKILAQHGAMAGDKIAQGIAGHLIDGVIFAPRDISLENLRNECDSIARQDAALVRLVDPQTYACFIARRPEAKIGRLLEVYGEHYFKTKTKSEFEREKTVAETILDALKFQSGLNLTALISPNILISRSFDSIDAVIAKNFIRNSKEQFEVVKDRRPLYATLAISGSALSDKLGLDAFLSEITGLDARPDGFYVVIESQADVRGAIYDSNVISGWMLINHVLSINGFTVVNGYSDIMSPFLGASGAWAGASGWFANLRSFSMARFEPSDGGRRPNPRYLCRSLLNRITSIELDALRSVVPEVLNNLPQDSGYTASNGSEPADNVIEVLQSWEAIRDLFQNIPTDTVKARLNICLSALAKAREIYRKIPITLDSKSNSDHLEPLEEGVRAFAKAAEIDLSGQ